MNNTGKGTEVRKSRANKKSLILRCVHEMAWQEVRLMRKSGPGLWKDWMARLKVWLYFCLSR